MATPSLAMVPSGYKDGTLYSVLPNNAGGDFDVTRGSLATRVNKDGLIEPVGTLGADVVLNGDFEEVGADQILNGDFSQEGSEEVTNGDFATDSDWVKQDGWTISGGKANANMVLGGNGNIYQTILTVGKTYKLTFTVSNYVQGYIRNVSQDGTLPLYNSNGTFTEYFVANTSNLFMNASTSESTQLSIDNLSVVEVGQNWDFGTGWSIGDDKAIQDGANGDLQQNSLVTGENYKVTLEVLDYVQGNLVVRLGAANVIGSITANGTYTFYGVASTTLFRLRAQVGFIGSVSNIIVEEVGQEWTLTDGCSITAQGARILSDGANQHIQQLNKLVVGDTYEIEYEITESVIGGLSVTASFGSGIILKDTVGVHKFYAVATNAALTIKRNAACDVTIDNIKIKRLNGDDTPRIDYTDGGCPVLLTEPQSTNLITQSNDFSPTSWLKTNLTTTLDNEVNPSGDSSTYKISTNVGLSVDVSFAYQVISGLTPSAAHSYSVFAKNGGYDEVRVLFDDGSNLSNNAQATFNLNDGSITSIEANGTFSGTTAKAEDFGNGWYRCTVSAVISSTGASRGRIYNSDSTITVGDGTKGVYLYGAQFEELSYATSLIPTYGAVRTRLQDTVIGAGTSSDFNSVEGVLFVEAKVQPNDTNKIITLSDGTGVNILTIQVNPNGRLDVNLVATDYQFILNYTNWVGTDNNKIAVKWKENDFGVWLNGVEIFTDNVGVTPSVGTFNKLNLSSTNGATDAWLGETSQIQVFKTALSDAELLTLTTI